MPTIIAFHPSGFEIRFDVNLDQIPSMITKLNQRHYRSSRELVYTAEGLPICPKHSVPMQKREKQGDVWYSHKITDPATGEVSYCRGYASPSSPGYAVEPNNPAPIPNGNGRSRKGTRYHNPSKPSSGKVNGHASKEKPIANLSSDELNELLFG